MDQLRVRRLLTETRYVLLTTFRRDGRPVPSPVWTAPAGDRLVVVTGASTGKVKRLRNDGRVLLAPCTARGRAFGESVEGRASLLGADDLPGVVQAMTAEYGWQFRGVRAVEHLMTRLGRSDGETAAIELHV